MVKKNGDDEGGAKTHMRGRASLLTRYLYAFPRATYARKRLACLGLVMAFNWLLSVFTFLFLAAHVRASALTTALSPNERLCFYADVDKAGEKIGVRSPPAVSDRGAYGFAVLLRRPVGWLVRHRLRSQGSQ